ncbi:hypothetical protein [Haloprofundus marisrubri]|uniref:hypothetical protein n=1 Tax=Haloprofundus marisrubri TaxID=1514971 RepID=UPI0009E2BFAD|nr:hypothetical protein [Haloprofundus marisrubri]
MSTSTGASNSQLFIAIGGLALVLQSVVFESTFGIVESPGVSGVLRDVLSGGLLLVATVCLLGGVYLISHKPR